MRSLPPCEWCGGPVDCWDCQYEGCHARHYCDGCHDTSMAMFVLEGLFAEIAPVLEWEQRVRAQERLSALQDARIAAWSVAADEIAASTAAVAVQTWWAATAVDRIDALVVRERLKGTCGG